MEENENKIESTIYVPTLLDLCLAKKYKEVFFQELVFVEWSVHYWPLAAYAPQCFVQYVFKKPKNLKDFWLLDQIGPNYTNFRIFWIYHSDTFFPTVWCWWLLPLLTDCDRKEHEINNPTFVTNNTTIFRTKLLPSPSLRFSIEHQSYSY